MYFKQVEEIARRQKRCTQRCVKPGETFEVDADGNIKLVRDQHGRIKWYVGGCYAVSPGRGKRAAMVLWSNLVDAPLRIRTPIGEQEAAQLEAIDYLPLRIRVLKIERVPLQSMTEDVAVAEGVATLAAYIELWTSINNGPLVRWNANPMVWRLWFEVAREP